MFAIPLLLLFPLLSLQPAPAASAPLAALAIAASLPQQSSSQAAVAAPANPASLFVDIVLERKKDGKVEAVAAGHVFQNGDIVRLRLKSHSDGYLYVLDQGTTGKFSTLFPGTEAGASNRLRAGQEYLVPAVEDGWFEVDGPPGFDLLYFLLSPTALASPAALSTTPPGPVSSLRPRCNDAIFKARGECMDDSAGPVAIAPGTALPAPLAPMAHGAARDLVFVEETPGTVGVSAGASAPGKGAASAPLAGPVIYTFRLAHQ